MQIEWNAGHFITEMSFVNVTKSDLPKVEHSVQGRQQGKE
jgi:hypothetical protein